MKRKLLITVLFFCTAVALFAQERHSVLWEVSGNGLKKPSSLLGTVHVASISLLDSFPKVLATARHCDFAIFESGGKPIGTMAAPAETRQPPLDSLFTPEEYALVDSFFTASPHGSMRPHNDDADVMAMLQIALTMEQQYGNQQADLFDALLWEKLSILKKPIFELDEQADIERIKDRMGYRKMAEILVHVVQKKTSLEQLVSDNAFDLGLYTRTMTAALELDEKADAASQQSNGDRNAKWVPKIERQMQEGSCFVAVGLLHLKYNTGLIRLLQNKGYKLTAVNL